MTIGLKNMHLPETDILSRSLNALKASLSQVKSIFDNGATTTIDVVTSVTSTTYTYKEVTIENGVITQVGDEQSETI